MLPPEPVFLNRIWFGFGFLLLCLEGVLPLQGYPQVTTNIVPDSTLPLNSSVKQIETNFFITEGTRVGGNLFHSFETFHVGTGDTANFVNPGGIVNILSRVTGGEVSNIFGTLKSESTASVFFLNPNGVIFGPDATLNVQGSFYVSTADYLRLGKDPGSGVFNATRPAQDPLLSVAPPEAFGFLNGNNGSIAIQESRLNVPPGETLAIIGGPIEITGGPTGFLSAPAGQVNVLAMGSPGEVLLDPTTWATNSQVGLEQIKLSNGAVVNTSGDSGGAIFIKAGQLTIDNSFLIGETLRSGDSSGIEILADEAMFIQNGVISSATVSKGNAGDITITTPSLTVDDAIIGSGSFGEGAAGNLTVNVGTLTVQNGGFLDTRSSQQGDGGLLTIQGLQGTRSHASVVTLTGSTQGFTGESSALIANAFGQGETAGSGGGIVVFADHLQVEKGARITSRTEGDGDAGDIDLHVGRLEIIEGGQVFSGTGTLEGGMPTGSGGPGQGGNLRVTATDSVLIQGRDNRGFISGLFSNAQFGSGDAGNLSIKSPVVDLGEGGAIVANAFSSSTGNSGNVLLEVDRLQISNGGQINTSTLGRGTGGTLTIHGMNGPDFQSKIVSISGTDRNNQPSALIANSLGTGPDAGNASKVSIQAEILQVSKGGRITSRTEGDGNAGNIDLQLGRLEITEGGQIFSGTGTLENGFFTGTGGPGTGGNISIQASESIEITGQDQNGLQSGLFSNAQFGTGNAGDLTISTPMLLVNGGLILASSEVGSSGKAGSITIDSETTSLMNSGTISVESSGGGESGSITLNNSGTFLSEGGIISAKVSNGTQPGGNITLSAGQDILLNQGAQITAESFGSGNAGNISLAANDTILLDTGTVSTQADLASGGNIKLQAREKIQVVDSTIASSVQGDASTIGGDINLDPNFIIIQNSNILAKAIAGQGGNISLIASQALLVDSFSTLDASSALGISGVVTIQSPIQNLSGTIAPLPQEPAPVTALYGSRCVAGQGGNFSTFVNAIADSRPLVPGAFLSSPLPHFDPLSAPKPVQAGTIRSSASPLLSASAKETSFACP